MSSDLTPIVVENEKKSDLPFIVMLDDTNCETLCRLDFLYLRVMDLELND